MFEPATTLQVQVTDSSWGPNTVQDRIRGLFSRQILPYGGRGPRGMLMRIALNKMDGSPSRLSATLQESASALFWKVHPLRYSSRVVQWSAYTVPWLRYYCTGTDSCVCAEETPAQPIRSYILHYIAEPSLIPPRVPSRIARNCRGKLPPPRLACSLGID